ncbi:hypothetical protein FN846DRAFT_799429 [Sphaerosporella brunnea]|uniref:GmrSD restriction endonucleases N-terminal domain-containing protein n=1 Tax=Sphaerosporella brunnea TaxID=1250544 RepID=A0A5J5EQN3_9PEZI|nr:hypothetical protein FN846DRAFT_799429 [Sphaerosporella brunnea]
MPPARPAAAADEFEDPDLDEEVDSDDDSGDEESSTFEAPEMLGAMHWHRRCVGDLIEMMKTPWLDLNPDYQRDVVWAPDRMTKLVNSLICKFYVPPVIFNVVEEEQEDGSKRYKRISIDGKQRLTSVREFVNGNIPCTDAKGKSWYFCEKPKNEFPAKKVKRRILPVRTRRQFLRLELICAEFSNLERKQEEDLFSRVQLGIPLTPAEKLRASSGPWQDFAISIEKEFLELLTGVVDNRRGRGFQLILQIFKQLMKEHEENPTYSAGASALKGFCAETNGLDENFKATARSVFTRYLEVYQKFPNTFENHGYKHATKFSPVEFVGVAVLIHRFPNRNARLLSGDILELRRELRLRRQDLRSNTDTWRALIGSVLSIEDSRGAVPAGPNHVFGAAADGATIMGSPAGPEPADMWTQAAHGDTPKSSASARRTRSSARAVAARSAPEVQQAKKQEIRFRALATPTSQPALRTETPPPGENPFATPVNRYSSPSDDYDGPFRAVHSVLQKRAREYEDGDRGVRIKKEKLGPFSLD